MRVRGAAVSVDRLVVLVLAVTCLALGAWFLAWSQGWLPDVVPSPDEVRSPDLGGVTSREWWPWALGAAGVVALALAVWWLAWHARGDGIGRLSLDGPGERGRLDVDARAFAAAAGAVVAARLPDVRSGDGRMRRERGRSVLDLHVVVDPHVDLDRLRRVLATTVDEAAEGLGRRDWTVRCRVDVARRPARPSRVV